MSFYVITTFSSRTTTLEQYLTFREYVIFTLKVNLLTVEIAYGKEDFLLSSDDTNILQYRTEYVLDHKYNLYNLAFRRLPYTCEYVALIDVGVTFEREDIISATVEELRTNYGTQMFACYLCLHERKMESTGHSFMKKNATGTFFEGKPWHSGKAWAFRKELLLQTGLPYFCILGGGDSVFALCLTNKFFHMADGTILSSEYMTAAFDYQCILTRVFQHKIGFVRGRITFPFNTEDRLDLGEAYTLLAEYNFIPERDIMYDNNGLITWNSGVLATFKEAARKHLTQEEN